jgi:hypothetical protein
VTRYRAPRIPSPAPDDLSARVGRSPTLPSDREGSTMDVSDTGIRWSTHQFHTQLLPGAVPVRVDVMERFDSVRATRHEGVRAALRAAEFQSTAARTRCPNCNHDLTTAADQRIDHPDPPAPGPMRRPILDPQLPLQIMTRVLEAIAGRRPSTQLVHTARPTVLRYVRLEVDRARRALPPTLRTLHVQHVDDRTAELFGLVAVGPRLIAYCARLDLTARGWRMTALRLMRGSTVSTGSSPQHSCVPACRRPRSRAVPGAA